MSHFQPPGSPAQSGPPVVPSLSQQQTQSRRERRAAGRQRTQRPVVQPGQPGQPVQPGQPGLPQRQAQQVGAQRATSARLAQALAGARAWARPATTGARLAAFAVDLVAVLFVGALVWFGSHSLVLAVLAVLETAVVLAFLEARTGATLGNLALRIRTVRDDAPYSPGVGRGFVRALVLGGGTLVALIGGFVVVATSAADPMRMGRSWADRAGRSLVVRVPTNAEREAWAQGAEAWAANALAAPESATQTSPAPQVERAPQAPQLSHAPEPPRHAPESVSSLPAGVVPVDAPVAAPPPVQQVVVGEQLLLTLDTGQRAQFPVPLALNLGRKPDPSDPADQLWIVHDPDSSVSKTHLRIESRGDSVWLTDLGSTNGSALLDETGEASPLPQGVRVRLEGGTRVKIGDRSFTVATVVGETPRDGRA